jgi:hypothetical protein
MVHSMSYFKKSIGWVPVAHSYNRNYSGGLQLEASPGQIVHKIHHTKRTGGVAQVVRVPA